jgi:tetratricopeptide (TPR) repeat protein
MSKQSRARAAAKAATSAKASAPSTGPTRREPNEFFARGGGLWGAIVIALAALAVYSNSFSAPFVLDDQLAVSDNPTIRSFGSALSPPLSGTTGGRPVLNLTYALNYALGGTDVRGYHGFNLLVHILAGLTFFGIMRRTFLRPVQGGGGRALLRPANLSEVTLPALAAAVLWVVHPLLTEDVTYISQRAESLMGLCYFLTLYCFIRGIENSHQALGVRRRAEESGSQLSALGSGLPVLRSPEPVERGEGGWLSASVLCCLLGVMCKEIIATAPFMVFLYDRTFVAGSFREAWRRRWRYYLGLAGTWLLLAYFMTGLNKRHVGFDQGIDWRSYGLTSCRSLVLYLKLAIWPHPLILYYGTDLIRRVSEAAPYMLILAVILAGVAVALRYRPALGFAGAWFFAILAPTSTIIPVALQPMGEHRVYLSLAAVVGLVVVGLYQWIGRRSLIVLAAVAVGLGWLTVQRNKDYGSELAIWTDTVAKRPDNAWARSNLGTVLQEIPGRVPDAIVQYRAALRINPALPATHYNLALALLRIPDGATDAIAEFRTALQMDPRLLEAHYNLGAILLKIKHDLPGAIAEFETVLKLNPSHVSAHVELGIALSQIPGRLPDAIAEYNRALKLDPGSFEAHCDLGDALSRIPGRQPDAVAEYQTALNIRPDSAEAHLNFGSLLAKIPGRIPDAIAEYETALQIKPEFEQAHTNLGIVLANIPGRLPEAISHFEAAVRISPNSAEARGNLATARQQLEKP